MTSVPFSSFRVPSAAAPQLSSWRLLAHLCRKEFAESRPVIIAGVAIFWLMPVLWMLVWLLILHKEACGFFAGVMVATGWFFAIVTASHTVCRDWGRSEGLFLQARPVSRGMIVAAKLVAGLGTIAVVAIPAVIEGVVLLCLGLATGKSDVRQDANAVLVSAVFTLWATVVGYFLAFAAGFVTRQTLSSMLIAVLGLVLWLATPLFSSKLAFFYPACASGEWTRPPSAGNCDVYGDMHLSQEPAWPDVWSMTGGRYLAAIGLVLLCCLAASFLGARRERAVTLGHRRLAWGVAVIVLILFGFAMKEVGNSLQTTDQAGLTSEYRSSINEPSFTFAHGSEWCFGLGERNLHPDSYRPLAGNQRLTRFRVTGEGRLEGLQHARIGDLAWPEGTLPDGYRVKESERLFVRSHTGMWIDESGDMILTGFWWGRPLEEVHRVRIRWPSGQVPQVVGHQIARLPSEPLETGTVRGTMFAFTKQHAYIQYMDLSVTTGPTNDRIYRFDFTSASAWQHDLRPVATYKGGTVEYLAIVDCPERAEGSFPGCPPVWQDPEPHRVHLQGRDPAWRMAGYYLKSLIPAARNMDALSFPPEHYPDYFGVEYLGRRDTLALPGTDLVCGSERTGMYVAHDGVPWPDALVGVCRASPLAMLWRGNGLALTALSGSRVAESDAQALSLYDLRDPRHPRRIGFFNRCNPYCEAQVIDFGHHLVLREGCLLTVLANPSAER